MSAPDPPAGLPPFAEALRLWARIGLLSFGGPAGQIALMHRELVEQRRWVSERRFLHALNFCTLLPGPEAMQLATYLGWLLHGVKGGLAAGILFIAPGAAVMLALSFLYVELGAWPPAAALFQGLAAAVVVLVLQALLRLSRRALYGMPARAVALLAFAALALFGLPFPLVVLAALAAGFLLHRHFAAAAPAAGAGGASVIDSTLAADPSRWVRLAPAARRAGLVCLALWVWPTALLLAEGGLFADIAWLFSKLAVVTFGGAYAVLAYVAQEAVEGYGWLSAEQMLAGLGLAETTPGPLILVLQFVGFLAGYAAGGTWAGVAAGLLTLWVTFLPCFAWIFLGAPHVERLHDAPRLSGALAAVTAAVVGVVANLALWFALRLFFAEVGPSALALGLPVVESLRWQVLPLLALSALLLFGLGAGVGATLGGAALGGLLLFAAGG
ncbi:MAG: chromate efflux transporter [Rhodovarius sp.]|nr:chromate efflux transporter [Rhodovarius sp.]